MSSTHVYKICNMKHKKILLNNCVRQIEMVGIQFICLIWLRIRLASKEKISKSSSNNKLYIILFRICRL